MAMLNDNKPLKMIIFFIINNISQREKGAKSLGALFFLFLLDLEQIIAETEE